MKVCTNIYQKSFNPTPMGKLATAAGRWGTEAMLWNFRSLILSCVESSKGFSWFWIGQQHLFCTKANHWWKEPCPFYSICKVCLIWQWYSIIVNNFQLLNNIYLNLVGSQCLHTMPLQIPHAEMHWTLIFLQLQRLVLQSLWVVNVFKISNTISYACVLGSQ